MDKTQWRIGWSFCVGVVVLVVAMQIMLPKACARIRRSLNPPPISTVIPPLGGEVDRVKTTAIVMRSGMLERVFEVEADIIDIGRDGMCVTWAVIDPSRFGSPQQAAPFAAQIELCFWTVTPGGFRLPDTLPTRIVTYVPQDMMSTIAGKEIPADLVDRMMAHRTNISGMPIVVPWKEN